VNFLPSGSDRATGFFAEAAARGGAAFVNCTASPAVHDPRLVELFEKNGQPLLGDDLESQFGSSLLHRTLLSVLRDRGLEILHSYQVNLGGNTDFKNLSARPDAKRRSKLKAISSGRAADRVDIIPSGGFVRGLGDRKVGYIVIEGRGWLDMPVTIDVKLHVQDSSNASGVTVDVVRLAAAARARGCAGSVDFSYYFKNPPGKKLETSEALRRVECFDRAEPA
jgi:myo-inositol-1-phosphate synthase